MGRSIGFYRRLLPPLEAMEERYVTIPADQTLSVTNQVFKLIYFLGNGLELELPDGSRIQLDEGDAISISHRWTIRYRSRVPGREVRNHVLVIRLSKTITGPPARGRGKKENDGTRQFAELVEKRLGGFHHFKGALQRGDGREILQLIRKETDKGEGRSQWKVAGLCTALVSGLLDPREGAAPGAVEGIERGPASVEHARHYILEHCRENLTLTKIAWQVQLSGEHLERLFKKHAGTTVFEYLDQVRTEKAKQLLLTTDLPVVRIASLCGYSSSNLLGRHFKARTGMTSLAYRLRARSQERFSPSLLQST